MENQEFSKNNRTVLSYIESQACKDVYQLNTDISVTQMQFNKEIIPMEKKHIARKVAMELLKEGYLDPQYYVRYQWVEGYDHMKDNNNVIIESRYRIRLKAYILDKAELESLQKQRILEELSKLVEPMEEQTLKKL